MKRYIVIIILGLALLAGGIRHSVVEAQRISRFVESIVLSGASDPYLDVIDTTNSAQIRLKARDTTTEIGAESNHSLRFVTNSAVEMTILAAGNVGIGTTAPAVGLHGVVTNGAFLWESSEADDTNKTARWGVEHYDVDEEPFYGITFSAETANNYMRLGGATAAGNAATVISIYTAANNTTTTGTERARINAIGQLLISQVAEVTPSLAGIDDPNTGIRFQGGDVIAFNTNGKRVWFINQNGVLAADATDGSGIDVINNYISFYEMTPPSGIADRVIVYAQDNGGTTELCFIYPGDNTVCHADPTP